MRPHHITYLIEEDTGYHERTDTDEQIFDGSLPRIVPEYSVRKHLLNPSYTEVHAEIKDKFTSLRRIQREKDALPVVSILKHRELSSKIEALEAEISKLRKKEKLIMQKCGKTDHAGMEELQKQINERRATIQHVDGRKPVIRENIHKGMHLYVNLINEFDDYDPHMLMQNRLKIRPDAEAQIRTEIAKKTDLPIQEIAFAESTSEAEQTLNEQKNVEQKNRNEQEKRQIRKKHRQNIR